MADPAGDDLTQSLLSGDNSTQDPKYSLLELPGPESLRNSYNENRPVKKRDRPVTQNITEANSNSIRHDSEEGGKSRHSAQFGGGGKQPSLQNMEDLIPKLSKKDLANMRPDERDEATEEAERLTIEWVHAFLDEVYRIDDFFKTKQNELINNFIGLQDKFRIRTEKYEMGSTKTKSKRGNKNREPTPGPSSASGDESILLNQSS